MESEDKKRVEDQEVEQPQEADETSDQQQDNAEGGEQSFYKSTDNGGYDGAELEDVGEEPDVRTGITVSWQASEYIHHDKGMGWYMILWIFAIAIAGVAVFLGWYIFAGLVVVMSAAIGVYAKRQPHVLQYYADDEGIKIGDKSHSYNEFRAFGIAQDAGMASIKLLPAKRLMPALLIYFADEDGEKIVDLISSHLPMEEIKDDFVDKLSHKLRF